MERLENLEVNKLAHEMGEFVWNVVAKWDYFVMDTIGKQIVEAADSIENNVNEGYGRFFYKENIQFCYFSRGLMAELWVNGEKQEKEN